jgi:hypothetical protein
MVKKINRVAIGITFLLTPFCGTLAQTTAPKIESEPPQEVVASLQQWVAHQEWYCPPKQNYDANRFVANIPKRMNVLGANGWEVVGFTQVQVPPSNSICWVATFRAPRKKQ